MNPTTSNVRCLWAIAAIIGSSSCLTAASPVDITKTPPSVLVTTNGAAAAENYETAPTAKRKVSPVYPYEQLINGRSGWAEASFVIDYAGRPLFANPKDASDPAFAKSLVAMIEASQYVPGRRDRHKVMSPASERCLFQGEASFDEGERRVLGALRKGEHSLPVVAELDGRPKALQQDSPVYPRALKDDGLTGQAEIEFVIDREGRVLFPHIVSATHEDFGWAAATAVAQWRFQPPQKDGQKVDAVMRVPILFDAHKLASSD